MPSLLPPPASAGGLLLLHAAAPVTLAKGGSVARGPRDCEEERLGGEARLKAVEEKVVVVSGVNPCGSTVTNVCRCVLERGR